jgi:hypothetical protein
MLSLRNFGIHLAWEHCLFLSCHSERSEESQIIFCARSSMQYQEMFLPRLRDQHDKKRRFIFSRNESDLSFRLRGNL